MEPLIQEPDQTLGRGSDGLRLSWYVLGRIDKAKPSSEHATGMKKQAMASIKHGG